MKKKLIVLVIGAVLCTAFNIGCGKQAEEKQDAGNETVIEASKEQESETDEEPGDGSFVKSDEVNADPKQPDEEKQDEIKESIEDLEEAESNAPADTLSEDEKQENAEAEEETLGNPRSSYGLGSGAYLKGKNILVSLFVTTPESTWSKEEQEEILTKVGKAVSYIETQAKEYGAETSLLYDFTSFEDLKVEAQTDFCVNEQTDFIDRLDEEIALWMEEKISYETLLERYDAEGIATMIFINNPGISYAIVYDGTDSTKETMILFAEDYYRPGKKETTTAYAHEILHIFGAHDLYEDAEFTAEVSEYVALTYPGEIMYTVAESGNRITAVLSPITAYHLGWIDTAEELTLFPQLNRQ